MDDFTLQNARLDVDESYVGFKPNGGSVKPVHIAGGVFRCIYGSYNRTKRIKRMALVSDAKGNVPAGNETAAVYSQLVADEMIEDSVSETQLESMRNVMQRLLNVDDAVYVVKGLADNMISYSAGSKHFLTSKAMYEDAGEFIGGIIRAYCPDLADYIKKILDEGNDPITLLFEPVLEEENMEVFSKQSQHMEIPVFTNINSNTQRFIDGIKEAGECLLNNFKQHTNPLTQLRLFNFFCIFNLIRYLTSLESFYCGEKVKPVLLDFSKKSPSFSSVARMSEMSYTQMYKSINRFYAWGYARWLEKKGYSKEELLNLETPVYARDSKGKISTKVGKEELDALWALAKERASDLAGEDVLLQFGETMYDMLALEASSHPVTYIKKLGTNAGILYPPDQQHPNKRFVISQDILEMLMRCCVKSGEVISGTEIRKRLWDRFGIVIGGSQFEMQVLQSSGMILQIDEDALEENFNSFASTLESMDFAEVMADGILQIRMGGAEK